VLVAKPDRVETLVECEAGEQIVDPRPRVDRQKIGQLITNRVEDERRAQLDVAARPLLDESAGKRRDRDDRRRKEPARGVPKTKYDAHCDPRRWAPLAATIHPILSDRAIRALSAFTKNRVYGDVPKGAGKGCCMAVSASKRVPFSRATCRDARPSFG